MTTFTVPEMSCGHCRAAITRAVASVDPNAVPRFDMGARTVEVEPAADPAALAAAMKSEGYEASYAGG